MLRRLLLSLPVLVLVGCAVAPRAPLEGVAIYMPVQPMSGRDVLAADLDRLPLQPQPFIAADEIVSYTAATHELALIAPAIQRLIALKVPVEGRGFVVCVNTKPVFAGAFWVLWSSLSFDGITINLPLQASDSLVRLYSGYPMQDTSSDHDPRNDPRVLDAFRQAGKLR